MSNVTILLDEEVARWVRIEAATRETSVPRYLEKLRAYGRFRDEIIEEVSRQIGDS